MLVQYSFVINGCSSKNTYVIVLWSVILISLAPYNFMNLLSSFGEVPVEALATYCHMCNDYISTSNNIGNCAVINIIDIE